MTNLDISLNKHYFQMIISEMFLSIVEHNKIVIHPKICTLRIFLRKKKGQ